MSDTPNTPAVTPDPMTNQTPKAEAAASMAQLKAIAKTGESTYDAGFVCNAFDAGLNQAQAKVMWDTHRAAVTAAEAESSKRTPKNNPIVAGGTPEANAYEPKTWKDALMFVERRDRLPRSATNEFSPKTFAAAMQSFPALHREWRASGFVPTRPE